MKRLLSLEFAALAVLAVSANAHAAPTGSFSVDYQGLSHGLLVLRLQGELSLTASSYSGRLAYHTAGMIGWMVRNEDESQVTGTFAGSTALPQRFDSVGNLRGTPRTTRIHYLGGNPVIEVRTPPVEQERTPVPDAETTHTIDTLSAIALLIHQVGDTGRCEGHVRIFDGRRLTALTATTVGTEPLPKIQRSSYAGPALRCDFAGNQLAGFKKDESEAEQRRTKHGSAWLAQAIPGGPLVPVKVIFENKLLGQVTLYAGSITGTPGPLAQTAPR